MVPELWGEPLWQKVWPSLDPSDTVRRRTASTHWNVPGKYGPHGELFFFLTKKEQVVASNEVLPNPCLSAETLMLCALIGLHLVAADYEVGSSRSQSPDSGDMWKYGSPRSPIWSSPCSANVTSGDDEEDGHNNECRAIEVIWQGWSSVVAALFLEDWELGRVALSCHRAMNFLCQK